MHPLLLEPPPLPSAPPLELAPDEPAEGLVLVVVEGCAVVPVDDVDGWLVEAEENEVGVDLGFARGRTTSETGARSLGALA